MRNKLLWLTALIILSATTVFAQVPTNDLVWEYKFENNLNETSGSSFNTGVLNTSGSNHSFVTGSTPNYGNNATSALQLGGDDLTNTGNVSFTSNVKLFTLSFWIKLPSAFGINTQIIKVKDPNSNNFIKIGSNGYVLYADLNANSFGTTNMNTSTSLVNITSNTWHHIAVKGTYWSGGAKYYNQLYVDGVKINEKNSPINLNSVSVFGGTDITIGNGGSTNDVQIDNLRFYKRDLTGTEITTLYDERNQQATCTNIVNIPDANLKAALLAHGTTITGTGISTIDTDGDGEICETEAQAYTGYVKINSKSITDATGLEAFVNITRLSCQNNQLTSLDVTANTALKKISCSKNQLTSLDISTNTDLLDLNCAFNKLTSLDVSANTALTYLACQYNQLTGLDVSANTTLISLGCFSNQLTSIDVSVNTALTTIYCGYNQLTSLNIANGNNSNMSSMQAQGNSNLTCIQTDVGIVGTTPNGWQKDATASYSANCSASACTNIVNIPDANLKAALVANQTINTDGDNEICESEAQAYTGGLYLSSLGITDATGLEAFANTTEIQIHGNSLISLDVSANTALRILSCNNNAQLNSLVFPISVQELYCGNTALTSLDVSTLTNLQKLSFGGAQLTSLDVSSNTQLIRLWCNDNQLTSLNIANGNNTNMVIMQAQGNSNLTCIQTDASIVGTTPNGWQKDATASYNANCATASVENVVFANQVNIYPNPVSHSLSVKANGAAIKSIIIYNLLGKKVVETTQRTINVNALNNGIYIVKIIGENNKTTTKKFVKAI